ncbi:MAG: hypothetical protein HYU37_19770 [Acidobacteria bacterium]|nr:hypothetical protein [Acidobacteriota bacterium]
MSRHPVVLALFGDAAAAAEAARALRALGVAPKRVSIVARSHDEEGVVARASDASPGSELEDSNPASQVGELGAHLLAAIALVMPGIGPIVADGPLAAGLGEAAGHLAGGLGRALEHAGLPRAEAHEWEAQIRGGAFLVGAHVTPSDVEKVQDVLVRAGGRRLAVGTWQD